MSNTTEGAGAGTGAAEGTSGTADTGPSAAEILAFDPFSPPARPAAESGTEGTGTPEKPKAAAPEGTPKPGETGTPKPAETTPPAPKPGETAPPGTPVAPAAAPVVPLEKTIAEQAETIRALIQRPAAADTKPAADTPPPPKFNLGIPPKLMDALSSEDGNERSTAMHAVVNGVANAVWNGVQEHLVKEILPGIQQMMGAYISSQDNAKRIATDFYGKYPMLDNENLKPLVTNVGVQLATERQAQNKSTEYSEEFRDAIAERIFTLIPALRTQAAAAAPGAPAAPPAKKQPFSTGGGSPPAPSGKSEFQELLLK